MKDYFLWCGKSKHGYGHQCYKNGFQVYPSFVLKREISNNIDSEDINNYIITNNNGLIIEKYRYYVKMLL